MQIIDVSEYDIRSAVITMRRRGTPLEFVIFPMVHAAPPTFFAQVRRRLRECDLIVVEGIRGKSAVVSTLTLAYRLAAWRRRNGLQEQRDELLLPEGVPVIRLETTAADAAADLRALPWWTLLFLMVLAPVGGLVIALWGPRALLHKAMAVEYLATSEEAEPAADDDAVHHALAYRRDRRVLDALAEIHEQRAGEPIRVAVVYGAGHVPAIVSGLLERYGYRPRGAEWLTVYAAA
ncbi:hypothetical protein OG900_38530 [Streptomyces sp. NBC_00433]